MARFEIPEGWTVQAFQFTLDPTDEQAGCVRRQFGGRRKARNWAVATLKADLTKYRQTGEVAERPSLPEPAEAVEPGQGHRVRQHRDR